jgi:hypothetical protein
MMKKSLTWKNTFRQLTLAACVVLAGGCGVEAGNPDSKGGKLFRIYVSPTSYSDVGAVSAAIDSVSVLQGSKTVSKSYPAKKVDLLSQNKSPSDETAVAFALENVVDENSELQRVEISLSKEASYLELSMSSQSQPVKAVVLDKNGELTRSLVFEGLTKSGVTKDIVVDIELRKTLKPVTSQQRSALNLPQDVSYVIQQKHSFLPAEDAGSVAFDNFESGSLVCVFTEVARPTAIADACTGQGYKSQIVSAQGSATIGALRAGEYQVVNITRDNRVVDLRNVTVEAGKKSALSGM